MTDAVIDTSQQTEKKRQRKRNWVGTQWIAALERGGGKKTPAEELDPKSQEWFEERLETLILSPTVRYLVYQIEQTEEEKPHYQIYIEFTVGMDLNTVVSMMHRTTDLAPRRGPRPKARHYCMKGNCGVTNCTTTFSAHGDKQCHEFAKEIIQTYREFGVWHATGQRVDLDGLLNRIDEGGTWNELMRDRTISLEMAKYGKYARDYYNARKPKESELELRPWQQALVTELESEPDDRKIIWIYDKDGKIGKSTLAGYLVRNHDAIVLSGSKNDIIHGYDNQRIAIFDYTRSQEAGTDQWGNKKNFISYAAMEEIKNGMGFSPKYNSGMWIRDYNAHVVIFANWLPDKSQLSADRWDIRDMGTPQQNIPQDWEAIGLNPFQDFHQDEEE